MGRSSAGGSSGGGRSSGGSSGGSRSFGGGHHSSSRSSSSSSRSSYGSFRSSSSSSSHRGYSSHSYRPSHTTVYRSYRPTSAQYRNTNLPAGTSQAGSVYPFLFVIWTIAFVAFLFSVFAVKGSTSDFQREKLASRLVTPTEYVIDDANWGVANSKTEAGMKYFFNKTGVQPVIILSEGINGDRWPATGFIEQYMTDVYDAYIKDEGHALFMYLDHGSGDFDVYWLIGSEAKSVVDDDVCDKIMAYFDRYATSDMSDEEYISTTFKKSADWAMGNPNKWIVYGVSGGLIFLIVLGLLIFLATSSKRKEQRIREMAEANDILNNDTEEM